MKKLLLLLVFLIGNQSYSQITLNEEDYPFPLDVDIPMYFISLPVFDHPVAGGDQVWELPNVAWANYFERSYFAANSDQFSTQSRYYVARTVFSLFNLYSHYYVQKKPDGIHRLGSILQPLAFGLGVYTGSPSDSLIFKESVNHFENSKNVIFPMTMGSKWEQPLVYMTNFDLSVAAFSLPKTPSHHKQYVSYTREVDGWGKMKVPVSKEEFATFDVLQVKVSNTIIDSFFVADEPAPIQLLNAFNLYQGDVSTEDFYEYFAKGFTEPLVRIIVDKATKAVIELQYLDVSTLDVERNEETNSLLAYPNPVRGGDLTVVSSKNPKSINVYDNQGNLIITKELIGADNTYVINIPADIPNGIYYFELLNTSGQSLESGKISVIR